MSDEGADETCDQTGLNSGQEDKAPDKPEESVLHQHDAGCGPLTKPSASATSAPSHNGNNHLGKTSDTSSSEDNPNDDKPAGKSKDTSINKDKPPANSNITSSNEDDPPVSSNNTSTNDDKPSVSGNSPSNRDKPPESSKNTSSNDDKPAGKSKDTSSNEDNLPVNNKDTSSTGDNPPTSGNNTSCNEDNHPTSNKDKVTSSNGDNPQASSKDTSTNEDKPPVNSNTPSNRDKPPESSNNTSSNMDKCSVKSKDVQTSVEDQPVVNREGTSNKEGNPPVNSNTPSNGDKPPESSNNTSSNKDKPSVKSKDAQTSDEDQPVVNREGTSNNEGNSPMNSKDSSSNDERPPVNSGDSSSKGDKPLGRKRRSEKSGYFGGSMFAWLQSAGNAAIGEISEGIAAIGAKMFEEPEESIPPQDDVECSQSAEANASESPTNAPASNNGKNPPVNSKDDTCSDEDRVDTSGHEDKLPVNSEGTSSNVDKPSGNIMNTSSVGEEDSKPQTKKDLMRYAVVGVAAGTAAVVAAPLVLGAAGFAGTGVAVGSIAAATVKTGGLFAMAASNAAIGGITGGIAALGAKMFDSFVDIKLLICGSGSEAHAFAGIASSVKGTDVRVFSLNQDEADYWFAATRKNELKVTFHRKGEEPTCITSRPPLETSNPEDAMQDIDIVVFVLPAFAHQVLLYTLKPYIKPGTVIVGLPGAPGFEFQVHHVLGDVGQQCTIVNFESSPWVSCIFDLSVGCEVLGTKETLLGAIKQGKGAAPKKDPVSTLQYLLGPLPKLNVSGHLLGVQLMSANAYLHTSILFGQWEGWQGKPVDEPPLFYNGLTEPAADLLSSISDEIVKIARLIELKTEADLSHVVHIHLWLVRRYSHDISNKSSLYKAIQTNAAFQGIKHPVKTTEDGKFVPDFTHRYMAEDVPYGLVVIRGIAEIVGVQTPNIDKVLTWCQEQMGKEYLVNSKLQGKDVGLSTAPQRYGFTTLESIL